MSNYYSAFDMSPVPPPGPDATPPDLYRGIYGMPMFVILPTVDIAASTDFWTRGLGFIDLFSVPGGVTHLRRWAFQDALLVPAEQPAALSPSTVSFSCVLSQVDEIVAACEEVLPGSTTGPRTMPWGSVEVEVITPENTRVVMSAAQAYDPESSSAQHLRDMGIPAPEE